MERNQGGSTIVSEIHALKFRKEFTRHEPESDKEILHKGFLIIEKVSFYVGHNSMERLHVM